MSGSLIRGNDLAISDVDTWIVINNNGNFPEIKKGIYNGVFLDIELYSWEDFRKEKIIENVYVLGFILDSTL